MLCETMASWKYISWAYIGLARVYWHFNCVPIVDQVLKDLSIFLLRISD
jgi:hypothetical protein